MAVVLFCLTLLFGGCSAASKTSSDSDTEKNTVTDILGRQVEIDAQAERVVAIGPGALRLLSFFNDIDLIAGVEQMDKDNSLGKPYVMANPSFANLPVIGQGGPNNAPDPEKILSVQPDVIFSTYASDKASADNLQSKTGIPVIAISYGETSVFDPAVNTSIMLVGKVIGKEQRAREIVHYIDGCKLDLNDRTRNIPEDKKPSTYVGGLGMKGMHGIESTQGNYSLFNAVHARNVADETGRSGSIMIDKEKLLEWNPDKIFIDGSGFQMIQQDFQKNPAYYNTLSAVKNGELYLQLPYNFYTTNIDTAIADAYFIGKTLYPEQFKDVDPEKKADQIYKVLLGKELYDQMARDFGGYKKVTLP